MAVHATLLGHLAAAQALALEAADDIVSADGTTLVARGARLDEAACAALSGQPLRQPLEHSLRPSAGTPGLELEPLCIAWIERSAVLAALAEDSPAQPLAASLAKLPLAPPVQAMLMLYARSAEGRLEHAVGVAAFALALARRMQPGDVAFHRRVALAGLLHDVGELYVEASILKRDAPLAPEQWQQLAAHPLLAQRVLEAMDGAGAEVAEAVGLHHERIGALGYPRGLGAAGLPMAGQIVGAAEALVGQIESGVGAQHARMVARLMPGEFDRALVEALNAALPREAGGAEGGDDLLPRLREIAGFVERSVATRAALAERIGRARGEPRRALEAGLARLERIQIGFSRSGLNAIGADAWEAELAAPDAAALRSEARAVVAELEWRIREFARELHLRGAPLEPAAAPP